MDADSAKLLSAFGELPDDHFSAAVLMEYANGH
jgi:hypothetical protein